MRSTRVAPTEAGCCAGPSGPASGSSGDNGETGRGLNPDEAERVRRRGPAVGAQRTLEGVDCVAARVRTSDGPASVALALCAPRGRFQARREEYARAVAGVGERIARSVRR